MVERTDYRKVIDPLTPAQRDFILTELYLTDLEFKPIGNLDRGHIRVKEEVAKEESLPMTGDNYLPVGFIGKYASLTNLDQQALKQYHSDLRSIYQSAMEITGDVVETPADLPEETSE